MVGSTSRSQSTFRKNVLNNLSASLIYLKAKHMDWPLRRTFIRPWFQFGVGSRLRLGNYSELEGKTKADQVQQERIRLIRSRGGGGLLWGKKDRDDRRKS